MTETKQAMTPVCPHCGRKEKDVWEIDFGPSLEGDALISCSSCGKDYFCSRHVTVRYSSKLVGERNKEKG